MKCFNSAILLIGLSCLIFFTCNQNPLFDDDWIDLGNRRIHGKVSLSDGMTPDGIFVWLEGFNLGVLTESDGSFELILPLPSEQPGGGLWGGFYLYYYIANYQINVAEVIVQNGYVLDNNGSIGAGGEVTASPVLQKLLDVSTYIEPDTVELDFHGQLKCTIMLQAIKDPVLVITKLSRDTLLAAFIQDIGSKESWIIGTDLHVQSLYTVGELPSVWTMEMPYPFNESDPGNYEIIPYILVLQPYIPSGLLGNFGYDCQDFVLNYLNIPFKRRGGKLVVLEPDTGFKY